MADSNCLSRGGLERLTAEEMDQRRVQGVAYQYLCHLEEAKRWMEVVLEEELAPPTELEESLRNGVVLAKLAHHFCPETVPLKKIYDWDQARYQALGLQFRHTDNINHWRAALSALGLPAIFYPETTDVYDKKNMPRVVYCLHALSLFLFRLGRAPQIHDLFGKVDFTDEEINNVKSELDRFGITMPAFHKIGGILANELSVDQAAVHVAVIAINEAVDKGHTEVTAQALRNPNALMENLQDTLMDVYQEILKQSRRQKLLNNRNKGGASEKDIYEEYLTQKEIQQNINTVSVHWAVEQVDQALDLSDSLSLLSALSLPCLSLRGLRPDLSQWYLDQLSADRQQKALDQGCVDPLDPEELQEGVSTANREYQRRNNVDCALLKLNQCLRGSDPRLTLSSLMSPALDLPPLEPSGASLYHSELQQIQRQCPQGALQQEELFVAVEMLTSVCIINQALEAGLMQKFSSSLVGSSASLSDVEPELLHRYFESLQALKLQNRGAVLTWNQLQSQINSVNAEAEEQHQILLSVSLVNEAVMDGDVHRLVSALKQPSLGLNSVSPTNGKRYLRLMRRTQQERAQVARDPEAGLWLSDIEDQVLAANQETQNALKRCLALAAVNQAVREQRSSQTFRVLSLSELQLSGLVLHCAPQYQERLFTLVRQRARTAGGNSPWIGSTLEDGSSFYFHLNKLEGTWNKPQDLNTHFLNRRDIQAVISSVSSEHSRSLQWKQSEALVVKLQAQARGFLLRRQLELRRRHFTKNISAVVTIQSHWRRLAVQRWYRRRLQFLYMNWRAVVKIQSLVRMWLQRRSYRRRLNYFRNNVNAVVKIQAFFRANKAREEYRLLVHSATPPLRVIRKFAHLLELSASDISEEAELLRVSQEVVRTIRFNKQLETDLDLMDLKIGLLVRNRATVQEVASHCKKLTKKNKEQLSDRMDLERSKGLKALSRERRERLEAYQHLFYLLQTQPRYLAQLVFLMPQSKSTAFMEMLVFSLFNYGSDRREGFLLLQLFTQALKYEISLKVEQPQDVVKGNPTVIKMLVNFYRHARGHNALREALGPALKDLIQEPDLSIRTDPTEVYRGWINQTETQTGTKSSLPYEVSPEEALSHPEVQRRIDVALVNLKNLTERVLKAITSNLHLLPYGLRYTAKVLRDALREKFPQANDNEIYKLVGNLVYYRYMNPAVVAPDGFDVLDRSVGSTLSPEQRHLLAAVARMLQHAAVNKGFQGDGYHVRQINQFISSTHLKFRRFFSAVCDVPEPEERFSVDEYSELLSVNKPVIYISLSELRNTHQLLVDHQAVLCSDSSDPLRALLSDLGSVPSLQELSGTAGDYGSSDSDSSVGRTEVSLTLNNKFDIFNDDQDEPDSRGLLLSTKQMIIDVIRTQPGDSLPQILRSSASQHQVALHAWLVQSRARQDAKSPDKLKRNESLMNNSALGLEQKKKKILRNLRHLQARGVLQAEATEGAILSMIAKDIRQQRLHRQRRGAELLRLRLTLNALQAKSSFHSEQMDFYRSYITSCLDKLTQKNQESKGKKKKSLCYSATRLQEKGVLLQIQDLPQSQFKNVLFEIGAGAERGSFTVKARFLGVQMEEFTLTYQELLQLQYEGVAVMKMFDKAKVNVNLLIFLLNKKFYNK